MEKEPGTITHVNEKGYGFIQVEDRRQSVFFHAKNVKHVSFDKLQVGDTVKVGDITGTERGLKAGEVYLTS